MELPTVTTILKAAERQALGARGSVSDDEIFMHEFGVIEREMALTSGQL